MKNTIKLVVLVALSLVALSASAQQKPLKVGHIDMDKLIMAMPETTAADKTLQAKKDEIVKESTNMREQLQTKFAEYSEKSKTYSDVIRASKEQELQELQQRIQRFEEIASNELQKSQEDLMRPVIEKAMNAVKEIAKEKGFTYVINNQALVYSADDAEDLMPLVKAKLGIK